MEWIQAIAAIASGLAAVLAWVAKIRWSNEFAAAKDETIRAKEAQIEFLEREIKGLQEMTPMKIREYFMSVKEQLEEYIDELNTKINELNGELLNKDGLIAELRESESENVEMIERLSHERNEMAELILGFESDLATVINVNTTSGEIISSVAEFDREFSGVPKSLFVQTGDSVRVSDIPGTVTVVDDTDD
jgi:predicted RNase H-like nuclease (RuvC/YqgF family)